LKVERQRITPLTRLIANQGAGSSADGRAEQDGATDSCGNHTTANRADGAAGQGALLPVCHIVAAGKCGNAEKSKNSTGYNRHDRDLFIKCPVQR
jgi:hypothetical protein